MFKEKCLTLVFEDVSIADAGSFVVVSSQQNISMKIVNGTEMDYTFVSPKPVAKDLNREYNVDATLTDGLCKDSNEDETPLEYTATYLNNVVLLPNQTTYTADIIVESTWPRILIITKTK